MMGESRRATAASPTRDFIVFPKVGEADLSPLARVCKQTRINGQVRGLDVFPFNCTIVCAFAFFSFAFLKIAQEIDRGVLLASLKLPNKRSTKVIGKQNERPKLITLKQCKSLCPTGMIIKNIKEDHFCNRFCLSVLCLLCFAFDSEKTMTFRPFCDKNRCPSHYLNKIQ